MWSFLALPAFQPFTIAALVLIGVLAVEIVSTLFGASVSALLDAAFNLDGAGVEAGGHHGLEAPGGIEAHAGEAGPRGEITPAQGGALATAFDWLNAGRVPLLVLIMAATACFAVTGMVLQILALNFAAPLPVAITVLIAIAAAIPGTRWTSRLVAWIIPRDETYVLTAEDLIGRVAVVTLGPVVAGAAARGKVQDKYGNWHFPRLAPGAADLSIPQGASVLIVDKVGNEYTVIPAEGRLASAQAAGAA
jgi:hypothetical protein